jgi:hypothetical protein
MALLRALFRTKYNMVQQIWPEGMSQAALASSLLSTALAHNRLGTPLSYSSAAKLHVSFSSFGHQSHTEARSRAHAALQLLQRQHRQLKQQAALLCIAGD